MIVEDATSGDGIITVDGVNMTVYTLPTASSSTLGGIKIGSGLSITDGVVSTQNNGTVTSVRVQATSPVQSSTSTAQSSSLNTTISLADGYGDTKNPYGTKTAHYVLAGPTSGSAAAPSFRELGASDIPNTVKIGSASFADDTSNDTTNPVKLTIKDSQSTAAALATANIPKVSSSSAGVAPKGAAVSTQSQSTKFLREDGTWAAPSYTANPSGTYLPLSGGTMTGQLDLGSYTLNHVGEPVSSDDAATKSYVDTSIGNLPSPMVFKGTIGTGGTIEWGNLPSPSSSNNGWTYIAISDEPEPELSTGDQLAKTGDLLVSDSYDWIIVPSGDEPSGTVTNVATGNGLTGGPITSSGTISLASAYGDTVNPYGSKTKNYVLASPNGSNGTPSFRALVAADLPANYGDNKNPYASKTKNYVLAAPSDANGVPSFRALTSADIPSLSATYKTVQTAKTDPSAGNTGALAFISSITQNANGEITATKEPVKADTTPTNGSSNLITSGGVYTAIQTVIGGSVVKKVINNPALTASGGSWTWTIAAADALGTADTSVTLQEISSGAQVMTDVVVNQSTGAVTITINDTASAGSLAANTYKAILVG